MAKISLITATYNSSRALCNTTVSVLAQTYRGIEYITIDGLSEDNITKIIKEYEPQFEGRIRWASEKDAGLYDAVDKGFRMTTGEITGTVSFDDLTTETTAIEKIVRCLEANSSVDAIYTNLYYVAQGDTPKIVRYWKLSRQRPFVKGWHPAHPAFYVKKVVYEKDESSDLSLKSAVGFELALRLTEKEHIKLYYLPEALIRMRLGGTTSRSLSNIIKGNIECVETLRKNKIRVSWV